MVLALKMGAEILCVLTFLLQFNVTASESGIIKAC